MRQYENHPDCRRAREATIGAALAAGASVLDVAYALGAGIGAVRAVRKAMVRDQHALKLLRALGNEIAGD
jgi:hypothetical protein